MDFLGMSSEDFEQKLPDWKWTDSPECPDLSHNVQEMFTKVKRLKSKNEKLVLPPSETYFKSAEWNIDHLGILKEKLNKVKSLLNDFQPWEWKHHTRCMNPTSSVIHHIRKSYTHEFCSIAWCKLFEILSCHQSIPSVLDEAAKELGGIRMDSVHLCEAPGAFVSATNHYLKTKYDQVDWNWRATSLSPYYEGSSVGDALTQDELVLGTVHNWTWLKDQTGNIMDVKNVEGLEAEVKATLRNVQLVTADGSFDCADAPDEQEVATSGLHFCEIVAALAVLGKGGTLVLKLFTFFEADTICNLYLLACMFEEVDVVKPAMSKEGNSEVYLVCRGYYGPACNAEERRILVQAIEQLPFKDLLFHRQDIPDSFINAVIEAALFFANLQISVIVRNFRSYPFAKESRTFYQVLTKVKDRTAKKWISATQLEPLNSSNFIFKQTYVKKHYGFKDTFRASEKALSKSLTERIQGQSDRNQPSYFKDLLQDLLELEKEHEPKDQPTSLTSHKISQIQVVNGKKYEKVQSSRFCDDLVLKLVKRIEAFIASCDVMEHHLADYSCFCLLLANQSASSTDTVCRFRHQEIKPSSMLDNQNNMQLITNILSQIVNLEKNDNLFLCSFPVVSRLNYSLLLLISTVFESVQFLTDPSSKTYGIFLSTFTGTSQESWWQELMLVLMNRKEKDTSGTEVLQLLPIQHLCQKKNFRSVYQYNNACLLYHCELQLDAYESHRKQQKS